MPTMNMYGQEAAPEGGEPRPENSGREEKDKNKYSEFVAFLCDRVEKATNATYRVTDLLSDKEPLKWAIREKAVLIFSGLVSISGKSFLEKNSRLEESEVLISQIAVLFSLFVDEKSVSGANFKILKREYLAINEAISKDRNSRDFYKIFWGEERKQISNGHTIGHELKEMSDKDTSAGTGDSIGHSKENKKKENLPIHAGKQAIAGKQKEEKETSPAGKRKERIYKIIKDRGRVTVGELASVFSEFSEKTIQRDLVEMVDKGILAKRGDKRWRTYLLKGGMGA